MGFNYTFKLSHADYPKPKEVSYQALIRALKIEKEVVHGQPMTAGGTPQAITLKGLVEKQFDGVSVEVWFQGNQVF